MQVKCPLRVSFFGGGTDLAEFYQQHGGAIVGLAINKYITVEVQNRSDSRVTLNSGLGYEADTITHAEVSAVLDATGAEGVDIFVKSDVTPYGCGLGTSSALICALLKALQPGQTREQIARRASKIGLKIRNQGIQDEYLTALGGWRYLHISESGRVWTHKITDLDPVVPNLMLFDLKRNRDSHLIQSAKKNPIVLKQLKLVAVDFMQESSRCQVFPDFLGKVWELKRQLSTAITDSVIDDVYEAGVKAGATAGKLLGAGGGGHFVFYVEPQYSQNVRHVLTGMGLEEVPFCLDTEGVCEVENSFNGI